MSGTPQERWQPNEPPRIRAHDASGRTLEDRDSIQNAQSSEGELSPHDRARSAILDSLYEERSALLQGGRVRPLTIREQSYLRDLELEIDRWEKEEAEVDGRGDMWRAIDELAERALSLKADLDLRQTG